MQTIGSFMEAKANTQGDWGERLLDTVATQSIRALFTQSQFVEVNVRCNPPSKLLQGSIDSFKMRGEGVVIRREFPVEEMSFETDAVAIDFSSILGGKIRLKQPTQAVAKVAISEDGINQAFQAELVRRRLNDLDMPELLEVSGGKPVSFTDVQIELLPDNGMRLFAKAAIADGETIPVRARLFFEYRSPPPGRLPEPAVRARRHPRALLDKSERLTIALARVLDNMVDLDRFDLDGVTMRLNRLETKGKQLTFAGYAQIHHFPRNP